MSPSVVAETPPAKPQVHRPLQGRPQLHSGATVTRLLGTQVLGACFPLTAGLAIYGWRASASIGVVTAAAMLSLAAWRLVGRRGAQIRLDHGFSLALLLAFCLPAELAREPTGGEPAVWPVLAAAGIALGFFVWLLGGISSGRVHPVLVTVLLLYICFGGLLQQHSVLQRQRLLAGDVLKTMPDSQNRMIDGPWIKATEVREHDALRRTPAAETLLRYTRGGVGDRHEWSSLEAVLRDQLPPLEDLMIGGGPSGIGSASNVFVIVGGLFLLYCGLIDARVPLTMVLAAAATFLILPVPVVIRESETVWRWFCTRNEAVGWRLGLTLANYELFAGPLMFTAFYLANSPVVRPITRRARSIYAIIAGVATAACQLYINVAIGPFVGVFVASLLSPVLDRYFRPRTLV